MKQSPAIINFNSGYFSPLMWGRTELKQWRNACRAIRNFIPTVQGPARRRPGTHMVAEVKTSANRTWLYRFKFNTDQVYVMEFGNLYIRFFAAHGVVGAPFEVVTPYTTADLTSSDGTFNLRFAQSGDTVYIFHGRYATRKLTRLTATTFGIAVVPFEWGPFKDIDPATTITVGSNGTGPGAGITLTASAALFTAADVGRKLLLEQVDVDQVKQWEPGKAVVINDVRRSDGKNYHALTGATTGTVKPIHSRGSKYDGDGGGGIGVRWAFDDAGYGYGTITAFTNTTHVFFTAITRLPDGVYTAAPGFGPTTRWAFDLFNDTDGYPTDGTFFRERLVVARGRDLVGTVAGDFENFADRDDGGIVTADSGFRITTLSDNSDDINWLAPSNKALLFGTKADEQVVREANQSDPFGPGNIRADKQSGHGSHNVAPEIVGESVVFTQRNGRKLREMRIAESVDERWESTDLTVLADDLTYSGIVQMAYQQDPDSVVWCAMADGRLLGLTLNHENEVRGWHEHRIGGFSSVASGLYAAVESVVSIPGPGTGEDELWMIVRREIGSVTKRYIEYMGTHYSEKSQHPFDAFYVDSGLSSDNRSTGILTPGAGATIKGTAGVVFARSAGAWNAGHIGTQIHYYYSVQDSTGAIIWLRASALITGFTDPAHVTATILEGWPNLNTIATLGWYSTVVAISGLVHLEGQQVQIMMDGALLETFVPLGGAVNLGRQASKIHAGLKCPATLTPMPIEPPTQEGTDRKSVV